MRNTKNKVALIAISALISMSIISGCSKVEKVQIYPVKDITMIIPYSAGGTADLTGRQLALNMEKHLGKSINIVNQPGASGGIGCKSALDAPADGYTILYAADSLGTQRVMGLSEISYNNYTPIITAVDDPKVIVVGKNSPFFTFEELCDSMKMNPGKIKMSYTGPGGSGHVQSIIYNELGMDMALTAYPGGNDCIVAVLGEQVDFTNSNLSTVMSYIESGDLKALAVAGNERLESLPDVPAITEIIPQAKDYLNIPFTPLSLLVNKDVPKEVTDILTSAANMAVKEQSWVDYVKNNNLDPLYEKYSTVTEMQNFYKSWESMVSWMLYDAGVAKNSPSDFNIEKPL